MSCVLRFFGFPFNMTMHFLGFDGFVHNPFRATIFYSFDTTEDKTF